MPLVPAIAVAAAAHAFVSVTAAAPPYADPPACSVSGSAAEAGDDTRAVAACARARHRFELLFGTPAPRSHVVLHDEPSYEVALIRDVGVVFWPNSGALPRDAPAAWLNLQWAEVLPHELMHALTMAHFYPDGDAVDAGGYGTPLPDWFEEAIAIWGEPGAARMARLAQARDLPAHGMRLRAILEGRHPVAANPALMQATPGAAVPRDEALRAFYPQSFAVLSWIFDRGGSTAVAELGRRLTLDPADIRAVAGLPGLPLTMDLAEADWQDWLAAEPRRN